MTGRPEDFGVRWADAGRHITDREQDADRGERYEAQSVEAATVNQVS
jgi:hypothetical protein